MVNYYHGIDVLVCLSIADGTPNPILEASACQRTWVSTDVGLVGSIHRTCDEDIKPGFIIKDTDELLPQLRILYEDRNLMHKMGEMARKSIVTAFSWDQMILQYEKLFLQI